MISQSHALPLSSSLPSLLPLPAFLLVPPSLFLSFPPSLFLSCLFKQFRHFRSSNILKTLVNFRAAGGVAASALISAKRSLSLSLSPSLSLSLSLRYAYITCRLYITVIHYFFLSICHSSAAAQFSLHWESLFLRFTSRCAVRRRCRSRCCRCCRSQRRRLRRLRIGLANSSRSSKRAANGSHPKKNNSANN